MRSATALFAFATFISRFAGLARISAQQALFGATNLGTAFTVASQIPNLIRALSETSLSAAFVPVFTELEEHGEDERAWRIAGTLVALILAIIGPLVVLSMAFAPQLVGLFADQGHLGAHAFQVTIDLTRILMPIVLIMALSALVVGILNSHNRFGAAAFAPVAWNAVILVALIGLTPFVDKQHQIYVYGWGWLVGTVVQAVFPTPWLRGLGGRLGIATAFRDPKVREIGLTMLPVTISLGLINVQQLVGTAFATRIPRGVLDSHLDAGAGPAIIDGAFRIYMLPQGIFSVAVRTVFFPALARLIARGDSDGYRRTFGEGIRMIFLLLVPSAVFCVLLAQPIVRLLYEHGRFDRYQTEAVAAALVAFSFGLALNGASLLLIRSFFSLKRPWVPTGVAVVTLVVNTVAIVALYRDFGTVGIAWATTIVNVVQFCVLYGMLRRTVGRLETRQTITYTLLVVAAAVVACGAAWAAWTGVDNVLGRDLLAQIVAMLAAVAVAGSGYLFMIVRLRLVGTQTLRAMLRRRRGDAHDDGGEGGGN
jgi:putative peptidoglycan lipid II flippase